MPERSAWTEYREAADDLLSRHSDQVPLPETVYHYTTLPAVIPIVQTGVMWCSNVAFANDPAEITYGDDVLRQALARDFPDFALTGLFATIADIDYYCASFCAHGDLLPLWRAYCKNGRGLAIGFDASALLWTPHMLFRRVEYDATRQMTLASEIVGVYADPIRAAARNEDQLRILVGELALFFVVLRGIFKHPAYAHEVEYRLFNTLPKPRFSHDTQLRFRATRSAIVPYYEVNVAAENGQRGGRPTLNEIIIGPCLDPLVEPSIRSLLDQHSLFHVQLRRSQVQMRA